MQAHQRQVYHQPNQLLQTPQVVTSAKGPDYLKQATDTSLGGVLGKILCRGGARHDCASWTAGRTSTPTLRMS
eukprot:884115-Amphidinium_carterae.1